MVLHIVNFTLFINPLVSVRTETIHVSESIRCTTIREKNGNLVKSLWTKAPEIPGHIRIFAVGLWVSLLAVNEIRELDWVLDKEDGGVVSNQVVITFFSVKLDCESSWISICVSRTFFSSNS